MIDIDKFCLDFRIDSDFARRGWVHFDCPFCGDRMRHLGYNLEKGYFFCFRCGWHPENKTLQALGKWDKGESRKLFAKYFLRGTPSRREEDVPICHAEELKWPDGCGPMGPIHRDYLTWRRFNWMELERLWGLMGTPNWGSHPFRVIAPIAFREQVVSWQGRDITGRQKAKYLPCPKENEVLPYKHLLYGFDRARWRTVVVVEGITGVWRLGPGAVATFGVEYTPSQLNLLAQAFGKFLIFPDADEAGKKMADQMAVELTVMGKDVEILEPVGCDSGSLPEPVAREIMREVRG